MSDELNWPETDDGDLLEALNRFGAAAAISLCEDILVPRALTIIGEAPYWTFVGEPQWAKLSVEDKVATLSWPEAATYYDSTTIETRSKSFDVALLFRSAADIKDWKVEQRRLYDAAQVKQQAQRVADAEAKERQVLAALKAKYGA
jgi:hypothetical protein